MRHDLRSDAQIRRMQGEPVELPRVVQAWEPCKRRRATRSAKLLFTGHARKSMARRGVTTRQVYLIWQQRRVNGVYLTGSRMTKSFKPADTPTV